MSFDNSVYTHRGPLARVWIAAHMERKLSKTQTLQTDISDSVEAIMGENGEIMALRISGQLLLGVVRIYNRKAKYLLDDCNEAMLKLKMAFRAGPVDMTNAQMTVDRNAITLTGDAMDLNLVLPDVNWDFDFDDEHAPSTSTRTRAGQHVARRADITLATDDFDVALSDGFDINLGSADGIGSYDFSLDLNLGLDGDGLDFDDSMELEVGRDAAMSRGGPRHSIVSSRRAGRESMELPGSDLDFDMLSRGSRSRDPSEQPFGADMNIGGLGDLGLGMDEDIDLGISFDDPVGVPELELGGDGQRTPTMGASPLTTPPRTPPPDFPLSEPDIVLPGDNDVDAEGEVDGEEGDGTTPKKAKRARKEKKQIVDAVIELANGPGPRTGRGRGRGANANGGYAAPAVPPEILATPSYVPSNPAVARLLEIRADPLAHFMPTIPAGKGQNQTQDAMVCAAPPGMDLAPELTALFMRPVRGSAAHGVNKRKGGAAKQVVDTDGEGKSEGEVEEPEVGRRQSSIAPSLRTLDRNSLGPLDVGFNDSANLDSFQIDIPQDQDMDVGMEGIELPPVDDAGLDLGGRERSQSAHPSDRARSRSRLSTPGMAYEDEGMSFADAACPIAAFDIRSQTSGSQASQSQAQAGQGDLPDVREDGKGYSKNTIKAINLIRAELGPSEEAKEDEEKVVSFKKMSEKASRRAASGFFFELLVLATRDTIKLGQATPYENIEISAKEKLWAHQQTTGSARQSSVAHSISSSLGL